MKVLVAEDTESNLMFLKASIEEAGFDVVVARDGKEAIDMFDQHHPDLVLLDVVMPRLDGIAAAKKIRERTESRNHWIPIIFISAMNDDVDVVKGLEIGGDDYICKPVSQVVLNAKLHAMQRIYEMQQQLDIANKQLQRIAEYDALTGLANRHKFNEHLHQEWLRSSRMGEKLSLCICDIDYFKQYNDTYGHQAGDDALCAVASALFKAIRRPGDLVTRYGGEEFAIILPETGVEGTFKMIERAREAVEELEVTHDKSPVSNVLTISAGIASVEPRKNNYELGIRVLIRDADQALYEAKGQGRNCVVGKEHTLIFATA